MDIDHKKYEGIIFKLASSFVRRLPDSSIMEYEDFVSEGYVVFTICKERFSEDKGVKFSTYFYESVHRRFKSLINYEFRAKRSVLFDREQDVEFSSSEADSPERQAMIADALSAMADVSADFVAMLTHGRFVSRSDKGKNGDLLLQAIKRARRMSSKRGVNSKDFNVAITKQMLESFFNISLDDLRKMYYNCM